VSPMSAKTTARLPRMTRLIRLFATGDGLRSITQRIATNMLRASRAAVRDEGGIYGVPQWKKTTQSTEYARGIRGGGRLKDHADKVKSAYTDTTASVYAGPPLSFHLKAQDRKIWNRGNKPLWFPYPNGFVEFDDASYFRGYVVRHVQPARPGLIDAEEARRIARETVDRAIKNEEKK